MSVSSEITCHFSKGVGIFGKKMRVIVRKKGTYSKELKG
jgi:hypothetical protein